MGALRSIIGNAPVSSSQEWPVWVFQGTRTLLELHPMTGNITYYFSTSGSDSNDGLTAGSPKATPAAAATLANAWIGPGRIVIKFKNGDIFRDTAGGTQLMNVTADNVSMGRYGTAAVSAVARKPQFTRFQAVSTSGWTLTTSQTNTYQQTHATEVVAFREVGDVTFRNTYVKRTSVAEIEANERSWGYISGVLHVNVRGTSKNPGSNGISYELDLINTKGGIVASGNRFRLDGLIFEGFCASKTNGDPYPIHMKQDGTKTAVITDCEAYWGPNHPCGHTNNSTPTGGNEANNGGSLWLNCRWGWSVGDGAGEQFVAFSNGDGLECFNMNWECVGGNIPFSGWTAGKHARPCFSHGGSPGYIIFGPGRVVPGPWQAILPSRIAPNVTVTYTDLADVRMFIFGEHLEVSPQYAGPAILTQECAITGDWTVRINCTYRMRMTDTTQGGGWTTLGDPGLSGIGWNNLYEMDFSGMSHSSNRNAAIGTFGSSFKYFGAYDEFRFITGMPGTRASLTALGWVNSAHANGPAIGTITGSIVSHEGQGTGRVGLNNGNGYAGGATDLTRQQGNTYSNLQQTTENSGWSNDARAVEATGNVSQPRYADSSLLRPVEQIQMRSPATPYAAVGLSYRVEYDANLAPRNATSTPHGRFEVISATPDAVDAAKGDILASRSVLGVDGTLPLASVLAPTGTLSLARVMQASGGNIAPSSVRSDTSDGLAAGGMYDAPAALATAAATQLTTDTAAVNAGKADINNTRTILGVTGTQNLPAIQAAASAAGASSQLATDTAAVTAASGYLREGQTLLGVAGRDELPAESSVAANVGFGTDGEEFEGTAILTAGSIREAIGLDEPDLQERLDAIEATVESVPTKGNGDKLVDHNYGSADALRVLADDGETAVDNATIRAYVKADYDAGAPDPKPPATVTGSDGRWVEPLMLDADTYYLAVYNPITRKTKRVTITVS